MTVKIWGKSKIMLHGYRDSFRVYIKTEDVRETLQKMLKEDLILQIINPRDHYLEEKLKRLLH